MSAVYILNMLAKVKIKLGELRPNYECYMRKKISIPCPWSKKGQVMRTLITDTESKQRQLIDGIRVMENGGWVLVGPDELTAAFNIVAESQSKEEVDSLVNRYKLLVEQAQT
jgi:mannose-1-phosphate guanylyltransferase/phosphomannomutase